MQELRENEILDTRTIVKCVHLHRILWKCDCFTPSKFGIAGTGIPLAVYIWRLLTITSLSSQMIDHFSEAFTCKQNSCFLANELESSFPIGPIVSHDYSARSVMLLKAFLEVMNHGMNSIVLLIRDLYFDRYKLCFIK